MLEPQGQASGGLEEPRRQAISIRREGEVRTDAGGCNNWAGLWRSSFKPHLRRLVVFRPRAATATRG